MTMKLRFLTATALMTALAFPLAQAQEHKSGAAHEQQKPEFMFVQTADDLQSDKETLRLVNVGKQILYFSDRPVRMAGHLPMSAYLDEWTAAAGPNNFAQDPPNATLSVYEAGSAENTLAVVEISKPVVEGNDLVYHYKLIEGTLPKASGATALFIDWIGLGGGVGPGFHGVGAGTRGVGLYGGYGGLRR